MRWMMKRGFYDELCYMRREEREFVQNVYKEAIHDRNNRIYTNVCIGD